jgi:peptide/nickel transport system substrate-binding protein
MDSYRRNYEVMAEELRQVGVTVNISVVQHAAMHDQIRDGVNPLVIYVAFRPVADTYLTQFFSSSGGTTNFAHYTAIDDLIVEARQAPDPAQQEELWRQANIQILKDFAAFPLMYTNQVYARTDNVDYGHELVSVAQLYPGIDETTMVNS